MTCVTQQTALKTSVAIFLLSLLQTLCYLLHTGPNAEFDQVRRPEGVTHASLLF